MFQNFEAPQQGGTAARIEALRGVLKAKGLAGVLVPRADAHQGEVVPPSEERLAWATDFTGSAGLAAVLSDRVTLFVDGRYVLQAKAQCDSEAIEIVHTRDQRPEEWLARALGEADVLGFDPWLHTRAEIDRLTSALSARLEPLDTNPIDALWEDRPPAPMGAVRVHPTSRAGEGAGEKRARIAQSLTEASTDAAVLTLPDSIAWLLNIRGADLSHLPVALAFAILENDGAVALFIEPDKLDDGVRAHLGDVRIAAPDAFGPALDALKGRTVRVDPKTAPVWVHRRLDAAGATIALAPDPCLLPKARKNATELAGMRAAHVRDGAAVARLMHWVDAAAEAGERPSEIDIAETLEAFRRETGALEDISFDTISASGPHGALAHYRVNRETNRRLSPGDVLLVDSGGQYLDGTTDITRVMAFGHPDPDAILPYTLVLKGMIAICRARWPAGLAGRDLDPLARTPLWQAGLDYDHGTGHGVGAYLNVHEGPAAISRRSSEIALEPGMVLSNEPGYYREGAFGIRLEVLVAVTEAAVPIGGERPMLGFETLTLAPIDARLIDASRLTPEEAAWLDRYHKRVRQTLSPLLPQEVRGWLEAACAPLAKNDPTDGGDVAMTQSFTLDQAAATYVVRAEDAVIAETTSALVLNEPGYDPVVYFPRADVAMEFLDRSETRTSCPHKGEATYFHIAGPSGQLSDAAWSYEAPVDGAEALAGYVAFDPALSAIERL